MKLFQRILSNLSFFIIVMLLFLLFFQNKVSLPPSLQSVGRMHPLLLHLPIGLLVISFILWIGRKNIESTSFQKIFILVLQVTAFTAALTALMGFFLSREGGYDENILLKHKTLGITTAILSYTLLLIYRSYPEKKFVFGTAITLSLAAMVIGSHFGSNLTHGEGFVWQPLKNENTEEEKITDSSSLFTAAIRPILRSKCFSCHNEKKAKGGLIMMASSEVFVFCCHAAFVRTCALAKPRCCTARPRMTADHADCACANQLQSERSSLADRRDTMALRRG